MPITADTPAAELEAIRNAMRQEQQRQREQRQRLQINQTQLNAMSDY